MNLFQQYGIKDVADVTFYSINRVGDEEFYTPVLFLDTLKVSSIEKKQQTQDSYGGYGNSKIASWAFNKTVSLKLEDALFSPVSMSLLWGNNLNAKFSKYTSAMVKINIANKYGNLNYSVLAHPSPKLTAEEWDIIYKACDNLGKTFIYKNNNNIPFMTNNYNKDEPYIEENRILLQKAYYQRGFFSIWEGQKEKYEIPTWEHSIEASNVAIPDCVVQEILLMINDLKDFSDFKTSIYDLEVIDRMEKCIVKDREGLSISTTEQKKNLLKYYLNDKSSSYTIYYDSKTMLPLLSSNESGEIIGWENEEDSRLINKNNIFYEENESYDYSKIISDILHAGGWSSSLVKLNTIMYEAGISNKLDFSKKLSSLINGEYTVGRDLYWGFDDNGIYRICLQEDKEEFLDSVQVIHCSRDEEELKHSGFEAGQIFPEKSNEFRLRIGTPYLKWSRTVKEKTQDDILGQTLIINPDSFSGFYKVVGETYIKQRKTGKKERFQFVINQAKINSETNITLQADGEPTVFSMTLDVFSPPNDIMMELRRYDVVEDNINGGTKILPQKYLPTRTETIVEIKSEDLLVNEEYY